MRVGAPSRNGMGAARAMEEQMQRTTDVTARRGFFSRIAAMSAFGLFGFATSTVRAEADGPDRPGTLKGRHKQSSTFTTSMPDLRSDSQTTSSRRTSPQRLS